MMFESLPRFLRQTPGMNPSKRARRRRPVAPLTLGGALICSVLQATFSGSQTPIVTWAGPSVPKELTFSGNI